MPQRSILFTSVALSAILGGCATQSQMLAQRQPAAVETALQRGRFDLNCPAATATVPRISSSQRKWKMTGAPFDGAQGRLRDGR